MLSRTDKVSIIRNSKEAHVLTGVKNDSATNLALAFNCVMLAHCHANSCTITHKQFHLRDLLIYLFHELNDKIHQLMLQHLLSMEIRNQERDIITLFPISTFPFPHTSSQVTPTLIGFLLRIKKASALCVKNLVNLCTKIFSISSACLILILMRTLFILGSIKTRSFSFLATTSGVKRTSGEVCASISGTLCRSDVWDAKLVRQRADVREERTHWR
jgi:hypothetical protein